MLDPRVYRGPSCGKGHEDTAGATTRYCSNSRCIHCVLERHESKQEKAPQARLGGRTNVNATPAEQIAWCVQRLAELALERSQADSDNAREDCDAESAQVRLTLTRAVSSL